MATLSRLTLILSLIALLVCVLIYRIPPIPHKRWWEVSPRSSAFIEEWGGNLLETWVIEKAKRGILLAFGVLAAEALWLILNYVTTYLADRATHSEGTAIGPLPILLRTSYRQQRTVRRAVTLEGIGLHSGRPARITIKPAPPNTGYLFIANRTLVPACLETVVERRYALTIGREGVRIRSIEHLLAAAAMHWIDNMYIEIEGFEVPVMDGSAKPFVKLLSNAGMVEQRSSYAP